MKKAKIVLIFLTVLTGGISSAQNVPVITFSDFYRMSTKKTDTTYVFNFWATWCVPCVTELPYFEQLHDKYADKKVKIILLSLDFKRELNTRVRNFVAEKKIKSEVYLLDDPDYNSWISRVDTSWGGGIPATLIINNAMGVHHFYEQEFTLEELDKAVKKGMIEIQ